ncbi:MAG TPA: RDD family protein [Vulgatibacter sp.]
MSDVHGTAAAGLESRSEAIVQVDATTAKADLGKRAVALIIDSVIAFLVGLIPYVGPLVGAAYWLLRDGLEFDFADRRSVGKKVMKLRPVRLDGQPMDIGSSIRRNWMFAIGAVFGLLNLIPVLGWIVALILLIPLSLAAFALGIFEIIKVFTDTKGRRLGDNMAGTQVIEVPN